MKTFTKISSVLIFFVVFPSFNTMNIHQNNIQTKTVNSIETIINDMKLPHEGYPHGVPSNYDWAYRPRVNMGNNPKLFTAFLAWGQLYEDSIGNSSKNTRVQIRNIEAYFLSKKDNKWHLIQGTYSVKGEEFVEDFNNNEKRTPNIRIESDGSISVKTGGGYNFHFWTSTDKSPIDNTDINGIFTTVQARLILNDNMQIDDRKAARYLLSMGADYWKDTSSNWDGYQVNNDDVGIGRFKYVTTNWQSFNMTSLSAEELRRNPPPIE